MPRVTGFTQIIEDHDDVTFEQYLWRCARGMMAFVRERESGLDAQVPLEVVPQPFYEEWLTSERERLAELESLTLDGAANAMAEENAERLRKHQEYDAERRKRCRQYDKMRDQVVKWQPPTPEHEGLKEVMLEQIEISMPDHEREADELPVAATDPAKWRDERIEHARQEVKRREESLSKEHERCRKATEWIQALHKQIPWVPQPESNK